MSNNGKEATRSLYVMWWQPVRVRWWTEEEVLWKNSQGQLTRDDIKSWASFSALRQRYGGLDGGRIRRNPDTGQTEVQERVPFGRTGPIILCSTEATPTTPKRCIKT